MDEEKWEKKESKSNQIDGLNWTHVLAQQYNSFAKNIIVFFSVPVYRIDILCNSFRWHFISK